MVYTTEIKILSPIDTVVKLFEEPENMRYWQPGFVSMQLISGEPGKAGAKSLLKFKMGKRSIEMVETILINNLPKEYIATYESKGVYNKLKVTFQSMGKRNTVYKAEDVFRFTGFMKLMGWLMPGAFKKQSEKNMVLFKEFVESRPD